MLTLALSLVLQAGPAAWSLEPDSYRGVKWGETLTEALPKMKVNGAYDWMCMCVSRDDKSGLCKLKAADPGRTPAQRTCFARDVVIGVAMVTESWSFEDDRFAGVGWSFDTSKYDYLRGLLAEKYGPPTEPPTHLSAETLARAGFENEIERWNGRAVSVEIRRFTNSNVAHGEAELLTNAARDRRARNAAERHREAIKSF